MGKWVADVVLDGALNIVAGATRMVAVNGQPASFAAANAGKLAEAVMAPADFTLAAGDVSGRKVTVAAKNGLAVLSNGSADHVALLDATRLLYVTTCPVQSLPTGGTVNFAAWAVEIGAPV
ncbi:hypothetical protein [Sandaracinobacteroides saxicola]|uniref:DUF2190 family protein n=1 Tax=Sandaracinobacteroides saxicola TaxID=2759707 RepID=A0A7G5IJ39_9SPHN|nr:hypothetical protein [Sandaracinobacteroides saxicola]QMW23381.1 hypothetical protein H3309_02440 [Sandaracinobacteroides saxicola]